MSLLQLFSKHSPNKVFLAVFLGAASGIAYALLIPVVMISISVPYDRLSTQGDQVYRIFGIDVAHPKSAALFLILCLLILVMRTFSQVLLVRISMDVTTKLRQELYGRISNTSISFLEQSNSGRLIQTMTTDVQRIVFGAGAFPDLLIQASSFFGLMFFLAFLSTKIFIFVVVLLIFGIVTFQLPMIIGAKYFQRSRDHMDVLQEGFKGLVDGAKELKLSHKKHEHFMKNQLLKQENLVVGYEKIGFTIVKITQNYGDLLTFFAMGIVGFIYVNYHSISASDLAGVIMVLLYISGPVAFMLNALPELSRANISLQKFLALSDELPEENASKKLRAIPVWKEINLSAVSYCHLGGNADSRAFVIGPIDAKIRRGEITFIVGGNGSGKSTFSKTISLHYPITSGQISFDDVLVTPDNLNSYRQEIACIYSDYYLFQQLHTDLSADPALIELVNSYLGIFELTDKVKFIDGQFSTLKLSDGQRRRLALLVAFLDDKALYVFDEWAADQDPYFKEIFYFDILPKLKKQGKAVVAISHDDRYFHVADQILVMENGKLVEGYGVFQKKVLQA